MLFKSLYFGFYFSWSGDWAAGCFHCWNLTGPLTWLVSSRAFLKADYKIGRFSRCSWFDPSPLAHSYLVMPFMGTDLGKLMKLERLSEDRVQFLIYQMLKGLKVNTTTNIYARYSLPVRGVWMGVNSVLVYSKSTSLYHAELKSLKLSVCPLSSVHPLSRDHPQGAWTLTFQTMSFGGGALALFHTQCHSSRFPHKELCSVCVFSRQNDTLSY